MDKSKQEELYFCHQVTKSYGDIQLTSYTMTVIQDEIKGQKCGKALLAVQDAMDILNGRWKIAIITALCHNQMRFSDLLREVNGISGKMLSRELKDLELNHLVNRTVLSTQPLIVQYELTPYGHTLEDVIWPLAKWGYDHRKKITGK